MKVGSFPFDYLGVLLFHGAPTIQVLQPVANMILNQFATWIVRFLSYTSKVCLFTPSMFTNDLNLS